jgi:hypothetical protein
MITLDQRRESLDPNATSATPHRRAGDTVEVGGVP